MCVDYNEPAHIYMLNDVDKSKLGPGRLNRDGGSTAQRLMPPKNRSLFENVQM